MAEYNTTPLSPARPVQAPDGWQLAPQFDPFEAYLGPYFERWADGLREFSFFADDRHMTAQGSVHGGALLTFADAAQGYALWDATDMGPCVTVSQHSQFLANAGLGDLIVCRPMLMRKTRDVAFLRAEFSVGTQMIMSVNSIWRIWPKQVS